ncbi:hypothetical protein W97_08288 [Coniosporium apollinis CBS 100218]|uniref:Peptidase M43 pregnancy-associated plasma-A domain-containing protein n=1 Tax=Coniosporium apollinis (strain CBS 100218) TaxID=1168221 RepID=R7Z4M6_CONA1|nr:uncharacterized protein W97_08288 [Coniosporium apollinis CBS 100218]EON69102.1 hypothetical protein W97_08288 [Coniosporium apollinis CBS 100218]
MCRPPEDQSGSEQPVQSWCGATQLHKHNLATVPGFRSARQFVEQFALLAVPSAAPRTWVAQIPVVVHVVYNTPAQNISQAQIESQIDVLNKDFNAANADLSKLPAVWAPLVGSVNINFFLAKRDPHGNATNGVTRTQTTIASFDHNSKSDPPDQRVMSAAQGGADPWPTDRYLNIWVCKQGGLEPLLGYANFPGTNALAVDGVVISHTSFGTTGTAAAGTNLGRTGTHEVGHWLNLFHIWGDDGIGCSGSDSCNDTPNQAGPSSGVPTFPKLSCGNGPNGDLFMNHMDYSDHSVRVMFTKGQVERINTTLAGTRASLFGSNFRQFLLQTGTGLHETDSTFQFIVTDWNGDGHPDLVAIKKSGTGSGTTEVHVLSGASQFQSFILHTRTALHETGDSFEFLMPARKGNQPPDLIAISKNNTGSKTTEVHILSGAKNYQDFSLHTKTVLHETDGTFQFALTDWKGDGSVDVVAIKKRNTGTKSTEVHILSGASGYQNYLVQTGTALHETDDNFEFMMTDWNGDGRPDLLVVKKTETDTNYTEVHVLSGQLRFGKFILQSGTILHKTAENFQFAVADWDKTGRADLVAIKKRYTGTGTTEVHIIAG